MAQGFEAEALCVRLSVHGNDAEFAATGFDVEEQEEAIEVGDGLAAEFGGEGGIFEGFFFRDVAAVVEGLVADEFDGLLNAVFEVSRDGEGVFMRVIVELVIQPL